MMGWYGHDISAWGWVAMTIGMVAFWALVITGVVLLIRGIGRIDNKHLAIASGTPEQILAGRFARGEIDETEYQARLAAVHQARPS